MYAVSITPTSEKAQALAALGAEAKQADMEDRASLEAVFEGQNRVLSVQNWTTSGVEGEIRQGILVADVAAEAGVEHLVYLSAGIGEPGTGVPHFESKIEVENNMRQRGSGWWTGWTRNNCNPISLIPAKPAPNP